MRVFSLSNVKVRNQSECIFPIAVSIIRCLLPDIYSVLYMVGPSKVNARYLTLSYKRKCLMLLYHQKKSTKSTFTALIIYRVKTYSSLLHIVSVVQSVWLNEIF